MYEKYLWLFISMISYILDLYYSLQTIIINTEIIWMNYINTNYMYLLKFDE